MKTSLFIALRYLFAKKSHNVINIISAISAAGMAIGTATLILILSVYNGFDGIIQANLSSLDPDLTLSRADGAFFVPEGETFDAIMGEGEVRSICSVLEQRVFVNYAGREAIAKAKGVDWAWEEENPLCDNITTGEFSLHLGDVPLAAVGASLAYELGINPRFLDRLEIFYPKSGPRPLLSSPAASLGSVKVKPSSLFNINAAANSELIILPLETLWELLGQEDKVSQLELRFTSQKGLKAFRKDYETALSKEGFSLRDRYEQNPSIYKMMRYEKLSIFIILFFVVLIVAFNIFASLSMLIVEKREDMRTLAAMGADGKLRRRVFLLEGWMISLLGMAIGLVAGVLLTLVQEHFGVVKMPSGFFIQAYPVVLQLSDVLWTFAGVSLIGFVIAYAATRSEKAEI